MSKGAYKATGRANPIYQSLAHIPGLNEHVGVLREAKYTLKPSLRPAPVVEKVEEMKLTHDLKEVFSTNKC
jgi:hypothetical protein